MNDIDLLMINVQSNISLRLRIFLLLKKRTIQNTNQKCVLTQHNIHKLDTSKRTQANRFQIAHSEAEGQRGWGL